MPITFDHLDQLRGSWDEAKGFLIEMLRQEQAQLSPLFPVVDPTANLTGDWSDLPFNAGFFTANSTGSIRAVQAPPYSLCWKVVGPVLHFNAGFSVTINNGTTTEIRVAIPVPAGYSLRALPSIGASNDGTHAAAGLWDGSAASGVAAAFIIRAAQYVAVQRWDGTAGVAFPNGDTVRIHFQLQIPVVVPAGQ